MHRARRPPPLWFVVAASVALACVERYVVLRYAAAHGAVDVQLAFWGFLVSLISWIWDGFQAAEHYLVIALQWSIKVLWAFATDVARLAKAIGEDLLYGFKGAWQALKIVYDDVLRAAWDKFWSLVDRIKTALDTYVGPLLRWGRTLRDFLIGFYQHWIQPILTIFDATRGLLRVLEGLHLKFAAKLDAELTALEQRIYEPFAFVLKKVNDGINILNRVVTADGLFQRLAYIKTLERDVKFAFQTLQNSRSNPLGRDDIERLKQRNQPPTSTAIFQEMVSMSPADGGRMSPGVREWIDGLQARTN